MTTEYTYPICFHEGYLLLENGADRLLLDTGSPFSFGKSTEIAGEFRSFIEDQTADEVSRHLGTKVAGLIGMDVVGGHDLLIDLPNRRVVFDPYREPESAASPRMDRMIGGIPTIPVSIGKDSRARSFFFDTGAPISYLAPELASSFPTHRTGNDFHLSCGDFTTPIRWVPLVLDGLELTIEMGILPERLAFLAHTLTGRPGCIGLSLFRNRPILLSPARELMIIGREDAAEAEQSELLPGVRISDDPAAGPYRQAG